MNSQMTGTQGKARKSPECRNLCPVELECATLLAHGCVHHFLSSQNSVIWGFYGGFTTQALVINSIFSPSPLSGGWRVGLKTSKFLIRAQSLRDQPHPETIQGPAKNHLTRTKGAPITLITQEIPGALGALCQEMEKKTKYFSFYNI